MQKKRKKAVVSSECVACGCCESACPVCAVSVYRGVCAIVQEEKCVGCGKCVHACPAGVISLYDGEAVS